MEFLKLKHNLKLEGKTIRGQILDIKWNDQERGDCKNNYNKKKDFYICSANHPELNRLVLFVCGKTKVKDNNTISYTFESEERAKEVYDFIMENTYEWVGTDGKPMTITGRSAQSKPVETRLQLLVKIDDKTYTESELLAEIERVSEERNKLTEWLKVARKGNKLFNK